MPSSLINFDSVMLESGFPRGLRNTQTRAVTAPPYVVQGRERLPEGVARRLVRPVAHCDRPRHRGADPLADPPRGLGLAVPNRDEGRQHVGRRHVGHGHRPDVRKRIGAQTARPGLPVPRSTLKNPAVFRSDMTRFVGRLEPSEIERNPVLDLAP